MPCLVEISHAGTSLTPLSLFTLLTAIIPHTRIRPLLFRHLDVDHEFSLDLRPSLAVFTPDEVEQRTSHASSFCHFLGSSREGLRAWLSICRPDRIEFVLHAPLTTFTLDTENGTFLLESEEEHDGCDLLWKHSSKRGAAGDIPFLHGQALPDYYAEFAHLFTRRRYIELAMIADYSLFASYGWNLGDTANHVKTVVHMANSLYDSLNIEIRLVHLEIFTDSQIPESVFTHPNTVLGWLAEFLKEKYKGPHHDSAFLMIARSVKKRNPTGVAKKSTICYPKNTFKTVSYVRDSSSDEKKQNSKRVVATLAHEMGHVLGMEHDFQHDYLFCDCPLGRRCIMHFQSGDYKQYWSNCSLAYLDRMYTTGADYCLWNEPRITRGASICGNGIVEKGEDCDCGELGCVTHDCCDMATCRFRDNAKCATGSCCDLGFCSIVRSGVSCRNIATTCDLPELCDGVNSECPDDLHRPDGETCPDDTNAICFDGRCASRAVQCKELWGERALPAEDKCYDLNRQEFGCGLNEDGSDRKCETADTLCGRMQCDISMNARPRAYRGWYKPYTWTGSYNPMCRSTLAKYQETFKPHHHLGMTLDGTSCGEGMYCLRSKCVYKMELFGCNFEPLYDASKCENDNECVKPSKTYENIPYCIADFGLQAELHTHQWVDLSSVSCIGNRFEVISKKRLILDSVVGFRCVRKRIEQFFDVNDCESYEACAMPRNCSAVQCDPDWVLQVKSAGSSLLHWSKAQIRCDSDRFFVNERSDNAYQSLKLRCVRLKCHLCENPCPTCLAHSRFSLKSQRYMCSEFKCSDDRQTVINGLNGEMRILHDVKLDCVKSERENSVWEVKDSIQLNPLKFNQQSRNITIETQRQSVVCELPCTRKFPLTSECRKNDPHCETWNPENGTQPCISKMFYVSDSSLPVEITYFHCNNRDGNWIADRIDNRKREIIQPGSNVYCHEGTCDPSIIFPPCEPKDKCDDEILHIDLMPIGRIFHCKDSSKLWTRNSEPEPWVEMENDQKLECLAGYVIVNRTRMSHGFQARCRMIETTQERVSVVIYIVCSIVPLLLIVIIALKLTGRGWLHAKIIKKLRGSKSDEEALGDISSKENTPNTPNTPKSKANTPNKSPNVGSTLTISPSIAATPKKVETPKK